jgi:hypothetical protein
VGRWNALHQALAMPGTMSSAKVVSEVQKPNGAQKMERASQPAS